MSLRDCDSVTFTLDGGVLVDLRTGLRTEKTAVPITFRAVDTGTDGESDYFQVETPAFHGPVHAETLIEALQDALSYARDPEVYA